MANQSRGEWVGERGREGGDGGRRGEARGPAREYYRRAERARQGGAGYAEPTVPPGESYGDYGHPDEGDRRAYGDMGMAHGGPYLEGAPAEPGRAAHHRARPERRWRHAALRARDLMLRQPRTVRPHDTVQHAAEVLRDEDTSLVCVVDEHQRLLGVVTSHGLLTRVLARGLDPKGVRVAEVLIDDVECATEQDSLHDLVRIMGDHPLRRIPVVARGDRLVGLVTLADIAREAELDVSLQDTFEEVASTRGFWSRLR